jgi:hypothetical protein
MSSSPNVGLDGGAVGDWCARAFAGAPAVARRLPSGPSAVCGRHTERALALRMAALVQQAPPYRALRGLRAVVADGWADRMARRYPSHAHLLLPFRIMAADLRPTADGWVATGPSRKTTDLLDVFGDAPEPGPAEPVLSELVDRVRRYFAAHSTTGVVGDPGAETGLARLCLLLARFENGVVPEPGATVERIHRDVPDAELRELVGLVEGLRGALGDLPARSGVAEPVFRHGWAEGDLVVGDTLVAVSLGDHSEVARRLRHLVAQAWLDVEDLYRVREVAVYRGVPGTFVTWPVADLAALLLDGVDPDAARAEFRALVEREAPAPGPFPVKGATLQHRRDCAIVETTMPVPDEDDDAFFADVDEEPRPGWRVTPNGPTCPDRGLAELALPFCADLPDGWRLDHVEDLHTLPHWRVVKRRQECTSLHADADGLAVVDFFATAHERPREPERKSTRAPQKTPTVYGPEVWNAVAGVEWTYWDLWFSVVCVVDHGGDWDALDARLFADAHAKDRAERGWSHLVDLRGRLAAAGITAHDLAGDLVRDRKTLTKARSKVVENKGVEKKHLSPAMRATPRGRYTARAHFGSWDLYPVSPRPFYARLAEATPFDLEAPGWGLPTFENVDPLFLALDELETEHADDPPTLLAVRRAGLTAGSSAHHRCDDSYGDLGDHTSEVVLRFSRTDWRSTGLDPVVFWRDVLEVLTVLANFGVVHRREDQVMANLGADRDRALLGRVLADLRASYLADRLDWPARELDRFRDLAQASARPSGGEAQR